MEGIQLSRIMSGRGHTPLVYFIRIGDRVKIGTTTDICQRVAALSLSMDDVALVVPGGRDVEQTYHRRYAQYRVDPNREWFYVRGSLTTLLRGANPPPKSRPGQQPSEWKITRTAPAPDTGEPLTSLREAVATGVLKRTTLAAARQARFRDPEFPPPAHKVGHTAMYRPSDLQAWEARRPGVRPA